MLQQLRQDISYAIRQVRRRPLFHALALLPLSLGIGANVAGFTVVNAVLLRPLPFEKPDELYFVWAVNERRDLNRSFAPYDDIQDWRARTTSLLGLTGYQYTEFTLTQGDESNRISGLRADDHLFEVLGARPAVGRFLDARDVAAHAQPVIVLGHDIWQQRFGGDRAIVGRSVIIDTRPHEVVGVASPRFRFPRHPDLPDRVDVYVPLTRPDARMARQGRLFGAIARVPSGRFSQATAELQAVAEGLRETFPRTHDGWAVRMVSMHEQIAGGTRATLLVLLGTVMAVLFVTTTNVGMLLTAKAALRRREFSTRLALGASRGRLVAQLAGESAVLAACGGAAGLLVGHWTLAGAAAMLPADLPPADELRLDRTVLAFVVLMSTGCLLAFGVLPAVQALRARATFRDAGARGATATGSIRRWQRMFVVAQIALATLLVAGAVMFTRTLLHLEDTPTGYDPRHVITFEVTLPAATYRDPARVRTFYDALAERLLAVPGVADVGGINLLPPSGVNLSFPFVVDNAPTAPGDGERRANFRVATPGYFEAMGIPLRAGRTFMAADRSEGTPVVIINQALATRHFPGQDPVGRQLTVIYGMAAPTPRLIIGVVGDVRQSGPAEPPRPELYLPYSQESFRWMTIVVRTEGDPTRLVPELRDHVAALDPQVAVDDVELLASRVAAAMDGPRFRTWLLSGFAALALLLALCGAFGMMSYTVSTRMPEIALRMALGATGVSVARMVLLEGLRLGAGGAALGAAGAALLERSVRPLLFGVAGLDGAVLLLLALGSVLATMLATAAPALRASRVATLHALKTLDA